MGLLGLLASPVTGPVHAFRFILEQLRDEAEARMGDEHTVQRRLIELTLQRDAGEISLEQYEAREAELFEELNSYMSERGNRR